MTMRKGRTRPGGEASLELTLKIDFNFVHYKRNIVPFGKSKQIRSFRTMIRSDGGQIEIDPLRKSVRRRCTLTQTGRPVFAIALASASVASTRAGSVSTRPT